MDLRVVLDRVLKFGWEYMGFYYSKYPAYVVDNEDPNNQNRLYVLVASIPQLGGIPMWSLQSGVYHGVNIIPEIGDMVWVEFQNGKLNTPIWSYHFPVNNNKPKEFKDNKCYGFKSPGGYLILVNETDKKLTIKTPDNISYEITEDSTIITCDKILLTKEDADQKSPLGNKMDGDLKDTLEKIKSALQAIAEFGTSQASVSTVTPITLLAPGYTKLATDIGLLIPELTQQISKFSDESHLSDKVKLT